MRCTLRGPLKRQGKHLICLCSSQDIDSQLLALFPGVVLLINCKNDGIKFMFVLSLQQTSGPRSQLGYSYFVHRSVVEDVNDRTKHRTLWNILLQWGEDEETSLTLTDCFFSIQVQGKPSKCIGWSLKIEPRGDLWGCFGQSCQRQSCYQGSWITKLPLSTKVRI